MLPQQLRLALVGDSAADGTLLDKGIEDVPTVRRRPLKFRWQLLSPRLHTADEPRLGVVQLQTERSVMTLTSGYQ